LPFDQEVTIYRPELSWGGFFGVWRQMIHNVVSSRGLTWRLFVRDFSVRYKQTLLGPAWAVLTPVITVAAFMALSHSGVMSLGTSSIPYPVFAMVGPVLGRVDRSLSVAGSSQFLHFENQVSTRGIGSQLTGNGDR